MVGLSEASRVGSSNNFQAHIAIKIFWPIPKGKLYMHHLPFLQTSCKISKIPLNWKICIRNYQFTLILITNSEMHLWNCEIRKCISELTFIKDELRNSLPKKFDARQGRPLFDSSTIDLWHFGFSNTKKSESFTNSANTHA